MAELLKFTATDAQGSDIWVDPDKVVSITKDDLGLGTIITLDSGGTLHTDGAVENVADQVNAGRSKS